MDIPHELPASKPSPMQQSTGSTQDTEVNTWSAKLNTELLYLMDEWHVSHCWTGNLRGFLFTSKKVWQNGSPSLMSFWFSTEHHSALLCRWPHANQPWITGWNFINVSLMMGHWLFSVFSVCCCVVVFSHYLANKCNGIKSTGIPVIQQRNSFRYLRNVITIEMGHVGMGEETGLKARSELMIEPGRTEATSWEKPKENRSMLGHM